MSLLLLATFTFIVLLRTCNEGIANLDHVLLENLWLFLLFRLLNRLRFVARMRRRLWHSLYLQRPRRLALIALSVILALYFGRTKVDKYPRSPLNTFSWLSREQLIQRVQCQILEYNYFNRHEAINPLVTFNDCPWSYWSALMGKKQELVLI